MKIAKILVLLIGFILAMILLVACSGGSATEVTGAESQQEATQAPSSAEENTQSPSDSVGPTADEQSAEPALPEDLPIMDGYRDFQATSDFSNISFIVDAEISEVVAWYQAELPNYGWEMSRAPDNAVGAMANMVRINADNDRLTIGLQHNPVGEFTVARITVVRGQQQ